MAIKGLVLAAGLGTRLRPLTEDIAKPALPVLGIPTIWFGAVHLAQSFGLKEIAVNVSHAPNSVRQALVDPDLRRAAPLEFYISDESQGILGSSGALWALKDWIGDNALAVLNGDSIFEPDWRRLQKQHQKGKGLLTMHLRPHQGSAEAYTNIQKDDFNRVIGFGNKSNEGLMFSGAYIIESQALQRLPTGASELMKTMLQPLAQERLLFAVEEDIPWFDTGSIKTYAAVQFNLLKYYPHLAPLVSLKMKEVSPACWVPKHWPHNHGVPLVGPCVLYGEPETWRDGSRTYGPYFIGMGNARVPQDAPSQLRNTLVYKDQLFLL